MGFFPLPQDIAAMVWSSMPQAFRRQGEVPDWAHANMRGRAIDSFIEGPSFDREGNLWLVDIPYGRIFRISPEGAWHLAATYAGWPNGLKIHRDGRIFIADYAHGIMVLDPASGTVAPYLTHYNSEHFRGCNDLFFDSEGVLYFTDQGQSGLQMPNGRVYRWTGAKERLDLLLDTGVSPNGLVATADRSQLLVAMTRDSSVWRLPLMPDGTVSKVGRFLQLPGGPVGPDGMALDEAGGLWIADAGHGSVWGISPSGVPLWRVRAPAGATLTNLAFQPGRRVLYMTLSDRGEILRADLPVAGAPMYSHS